MTHLRKMMLEELQRRNYAKTTIDCYLRTVEDFSRHFHCSPDRLGPRHIREYQAGVVPETEVLAEHGGATPGGSAILLHQDAQESLEHRRDSLPEEDCSPANDPQPGRSCPAH